MRKAIFRFWGGLVHIVLLVVATGLLAAVKVARSILATVEERGGIDGSIAHLSPWEQSTWSWIERYGALREPSFLAIGCVVATLLAASCQSRSYRRLRFSLLWLSLHLAVYVLAAAQIVDLVQDTRVWNTDYSEFIVAGAAMVAAAGLLAKAIIGSQLVAHASDATWTRRNGAGGGPGESKKPALLRSQVETGKRLLDAVLADPEIGSGHVVQLVGHWGSGKSTILRDFASKIANGDTEESVVNRYAMSSERQYSRCKWTSRRRKRPAVAMLHIWRHEDNRDLHRAIVEAIIGSHLILEGERLISYRWLRIPSALLIARHLRAITLSLTVSVRGSEMKAESIKVPDLFAQRSLDYFLTSGRPTIVILDEIDRATPEVAQAVITLVRRSLDVAGCTTVLAYAEHIVRFKTMNPMSPLLPDIRSSVEALLSIHIGPPGIEDFNDPNIFRTSDDGTGNWFDQSDWLRRQWLLAQHGKGEKSHYISVDDFYKVIEQKYLSSNIVTVEPATLFGIVGTEPYCTAICGQCPGKEDQKGATFQLRCELCALLCSRDILWRLVRLRDKSNSEDSSLDDWWLDGNHRTLVEGIRIHKAERMLSLGKLAADLSMARTNDGNGRSVLELVRNNELPEWIVPFERFIDELAQHGVAGSGALGGNVEIGRLIDAHLPIRRLVSAWVASLDQLQRELSTRPDPGWDVVSDRLAVQFVDSALRIACDNVHRLMALPQEVSNPEGGLDELTAVGEMDQKEN